MSFTIKLRRGIAAEFTADNPILAAGEPGWELDTHKLKIGDGFLHWNDLPYYPGAGIISGVTSVDGRSGVVTLNDLYAALAHAHAGSDISSGTVATARLNVGTASGTVAAGDHSHVHSHVTGPAPVVLTPGTNVATDATLGTLFRLAPTSNFTLSNPTGMVDGQRALWEITQDATGGRVMTLGSAFAFGADIPSVTLSTAANKKDIFGAIYNAALGKWLIVAFTKGF